MGASGSSGIQVQFDRPNSFYFTGEQLAGNASFQNNDDKLTLDSIFLELVGELGYTTQEVRRFRDDSGHERTEHYTKHHQPVFTHIRIPLVEPQYGQREITLYRGQHSWPFRLVLPHTLPPTLLPATTSTYPYVKYYMRVVLDKPWYKPNAKQIYPLTIFPRVNILHVPGGQQPAAFSNENRKKLRLQGYIVRSGVVPGERLSVQITLQNPKRAEIKRIEVKLIQHRQVVRSSHSEVILRSDVPDLQEFNGTELQRTFELAVPAVYLSPTYTYLAHGAGEALGVSVHYELAMEVKARGFFTDFKLSAPIIVGTEPSSVEQQQQQAFAYEQQYLNNPVEMPTASAPVLDYDEPPPSYESVVRNEKT